jgi:hypothetical protein
MRFPRAHLRLLAVIALWCASCLAPAGLELRLCGCGSWLASWLRATSADCGQERLEEASEAQVPAIASCCEPAAERARVPTAERAEPNERKPASHCDPAHERCACLLIETGAEPAHASWLAGAQADAQRASALAGAASLQMRAAPSLACVHGLAHRAWLHDRSPPGERCSIPLRI